MALWTCDDFGEGDYGWAGHHLGKTKPSLRTSAAREQQMQDA
jgi:hypothetical protein